MSKPCSTPARIFCKTDFHVRNEIFCEYDFKTIYIGCGRNILNLFILGLRATLYRNQDNSSAVFLAFYSITSDCVRTKSKVHDTHFIKPTGLEPFQLKDDRQQNFLTNKIFNLISIVTQDY